MPPEVDVVLPPEVDVVLPPEVEVVLPLVVEVVDVVEPPVDVEVLDDELFELLLDFEPFEDLLLLLDFDDLLLLELLLDFDALLNQLDALASLGVAATIPAVASEAPMSAAWVILMYCMILAPYRMSLNVKF